jgi:hypothetical protein
MAGLRSDEHLVVQIVLSPPRDPKLDLRHLALARRICQETNGPRDVELADAAENKAVSPKMLAAVRVAVAAPTRQDGRRLLRQAKQALRSTTRLNHLVPMAPGSAQDFLTRFRARAPGTIPLSLWELPVIWGFGSQKRPPGVLSAASRVLPLRTQPPASSGLRLGIVRTSEGYVPLLLPLGPGTPHLSIVGVTGGGKTVAATAIARRLAELGYGVTFIQPKSTTQGRDLARQLSALGREVTTLDPALPDNSAGVDLIKIARDAANPDLWVEYMTTILGHLAGGAGPGPRQVAMTRSGNKLLTELSDTGLLNLLDLFMNSSWRRERLPLTQDREARAFIELQLDRQSPSEAMSAALPVVNTISPVLTNPFLRRLLRAEPQFDPGRHLLNEDVLIVNAAEGLIGSAASDLLTAMTVSIIHLTAAAMPERRPRDHFLIIDEAHRLPADVMVRVLSESREHQLKLCLITQSFSSLPSEVRFALDANAGGLIAFRLGLEDARLVAEKMGHPVTAEDLMRQPNFRAICRFAMPGWMSEPFTLIADPPLKLPDEADFNQQRAQREPTTATVSAVQPVLTAPLVTRRLPDIDED